MKTSSIREILELGYRLGGRIAENTDALYPSQEHIYDIGNRCCSLDMGFLRNLGVFIKDHGKKISIEKLLEKIAAKAEQRGEEPLTGVDANDIIREYAQELNAQQHIPVSQTTFVSSTVPSVAFQSPVMESYIKKFNKVYTEGKKRKQSDQPVCELTKQDILSFIEQHPEIDDEVLTKKEREEAQEITYKVTDTTVDIIVTTKDGQNKLQTIDVEAFCKKYLEDYLKEHDMIPNVSHEVIVNPDEMGKKNPSIRGFTESATEHLELAKNLTTSIANRIMQHELGLPSDDKAHLLSRLNLLQQRIEQLENEVLQLTRQLIEPTDDISDTYPTYAIAIIGNNVDDEQPFVVTRSLNDESDEPLRDDSHNQTDHEEENEEDEEEDKEEDEETLDDDEDEKHRI